MALMCCFVLSLPYSWNPRSWTSLQAWSLNLWSSWNGHIFLRDLHAVQTRSVLFSQLWAEGGERLPSSNFLSAVGQLTTEVVDLTYPARDLGQFVVSWDEIDHHALLTSAVQQRQRSGPSTDAWQTLQSTMKSAVWLPVTKKVRQ